MGFERNMRRWALAIALALGADGAGAAPPEPLLVTALPDAKLTLLSRQADQSSEESLDQATERFRLAVAEALQLDQRAVEEACKSRAADAKSSAYFQWQARCLYRRR
jgi:hypothetical protein